MVVSGEKHQPPCSAQASQNLDPCIMEDALPRTLSYSCWAAFGGTMPLSPNLLSVQHLGCAVNSLVGRVMEGGRGT